jgi:hypothetical protein
MKLNEPQNIEQNFDELELVAEKAGELNDRVGKIENELGAQTKTLESAAMVLDAAIKGLGALKHQVLENDIGALQLALNDKTAHLAREIGRFESAVAEIDRRAEAGDEQLAASLRDIALGLRSSFDAKSVEIAEWSVRVEREIAAHSVALAAIPPVIKGADAKPFNPRGEWQAGMIANSLDVVSYNGSSYISNEDGNTEKPTRSTKYTTLAKRSGNGAGGATDFGSLTGTILPAQVVPGSATYAVGDVLYAGTTGALSKLTAGSSGQLLSTQGAGAAPRWVSATGGAGDVNGPASATDNAIVRFDGTGGKTVQNSAVTIADTTGDIAGATSLTAPAATALTLAGGTSGASLVLGQGTNGGVTLTPTAAGSGNTRTTFSRSTAYSAASISADFVIYNPDQTDNNYSSLAFGSRATSGSVIDPGSTISSITTVHNTATGYATQLAFGTRNSNTLTEGMRLTDKQNLLIGATTDITGTGGLHVAGTGTATAVGAGGGGAFRVGTNVNLSGNSGGASYFGGYIYAGDGSADARIIAQTNNPYALAVNRGGSGNGRFYLGATAVASPSLVFSNNAGTEVASISGTGAATFAGAVTIGGSANLSIQSGAGLFLDGGSNTYIVENTADSVQVKAGGLTALTTTSALTTVNGNLTVSGTGTSALAGAVTGASTIQVGTVLRVGGATASFPGLRNTGAQLDVVTASNSAWADIAAAQFKQSDNGISWSSGTGSPEGVKTAPVGSLYSRTDGGASTTLYVKQSGAGNTGWVAK